MRTVWFPGHMAKGKRQLEGLAASLDVVVEVRDARAPRMCSSPAVGLLGERIDVWTVLSKADLADEKTTDKWLDALRAQGLNPWALDLRGSAKKGGDGKKYTLAPFLKALSARSARIAHRELRLAVVGIPNGGKSLLLNQILGKKRAAVGGIPGVTKGVSWFRAGNLLVVDSPGILDPRADPRIHRMLSWLASTRGQVVGSWEQHALECIAFLVRHEKWSGIEAAWGIAASSGTSSPELLEAIGKRLGKIQKGGRVDVEAAAKTFLESFAAGKLGRVSLEAPTSQPPWEELS